MPIAHDVGVHRLATGKRLNGFGSDRPAFSEREVFELFGSLFFGAVGKIEALPGQLPPGTRAVVLEMHRLISMDSSGLDAMEQFHRTLQRQGIALVLANVNEQPLSLIQRSGFDAVLGADAIVPSVAQALHAQWAT